MSKNDRVRLRPRESTVPHPVKGKLAGIRGGKREEKVSQVVHPNLAGRWSGRRGHRQCANNSDRTIRCVVNFWIRKGGPAARKWSGSKEDP